MVSSMNAPAIAADERLRRKDRLGVIISKDLPPLRTHGGRTQVGSRQSKD